MDDRAARRRDYAASHPTVRISTKRFQTSPFLDRYASDEVVFGAYSGRLYPLTLGEDVVGSYWSLRRAAVLYDVPERPLEIEGADAERLLDDVLTRDVTKLVVGRAKYAIACQADGGILMDGILMRLAEDRFWFIPADGEIRGWLEAHALGLDARIRDAGAWVLQVQGPRSLDVLGAACDGGAPDPFPFFAVSGAAMGGQPVLVSRTGWTGELGFEVYTREGVDGPALWDHLMRAGLPHGLIFGSAQSMGIRRIEAGILDNGTDMDASMTPFQAGLGRFVELEKRDFVGKRALERADRRCLLHGIRCASTTPVAGTHVLAGDVRVGHVTVGAWSPALEAGIGYVRLAEPGDWVGREVTLREGGTDHAAEVVALPFYDPERRIPRGVNPGVP